MPDVDFDLSPAPATAEPNPTVPNQLTSPTSNTPAPATPAPAVDHTPGGLPAIPLAVITSNTTIGALSAAAVAGGPLAVAGVLGAIGAVAVGSAVATRSKSRRSTARARTASGSASRSGSGSTTSRTGGRTGSGSRSTGGSAARLGAAGARKSSAGASAGRTGGATKTPTRTGSGSKSAGAGGRNGSRTGGGSGGGAGGGGKKGGRAAQIKALRDARRDAAPTRKEQRGKDTADRRALRDARRAAKDGGLNLGKKNKTKNAPKHGANDPAAAAGGNKLKNNRGGKTSTLGKPTNGTQPGAAGPSVKGQAADTLHKPMVKASRRDRLRNWGRAQRDQLAASRTERIQRARRNAKARWRLSRRWTGSGIRFAARWTAAALLAAPVGLLGCLTTPLGRKIRVASLMYPGRRLFWRLVGRAKYAHQDRMDAARAEYDAAAAAAATGTAPVDPIAETVPRAPQSAIAPTTGEPDVSEVLKFLFEESAAEMEAAAQAYEPGGMMHVYQTIQGMPAGIESWANTFKILAEKSDDSFPLEPEVGEALSDVFDLLRKAATAAEEVRQVFEKAHEHDIERLTAPRISLEAEKTWDAGANEEYL